MRRDPVPARVLGPSSDGMLGGDQALQEVLPRQAGPGAGQHRLQQRKPFRDLLGPPARSILVGQQHQPTRRIGPGIAPGVLQQHQGQQRPRLRRLRPQPDQQPTEPDRLAGHGGAGHLGAAGRRVRRREGQVDHSTDRGQPERQVRALRDGEEVARASHGPLRPGQPCRHGRLRRVKDRGDVGRRHTYDQPQGECGRSVRRQRRVSTEEHQPEPLVPQAVTHVSHHPLGLLLQLRIDHQERLLAGRRGLAAQPVENLAPGGGQQPAGWVAGHPVNRPVPSGGEKGVAQPVFGQVQPSELRNQQGEQPPPLVAEDLVQRPLAHQPPC